MSKEKGFAAPIIILGILVVFGVALTAYNFGKKDFLNTQKTTTTTLPSASNIEYSNTTLGFKLTLPDDWTICDPTYVSGEIGLEPRKVPSNECLGYFITTPDYYFYPGNPSIARKVDEPFIDYVRRLDEAYMQQPQVAKSSQSKPRVEFKNIDSSTVQKKITTRYPENLPLGTRGQVLYMEDPQKNTLIISSKYSDVTSGEDDPYLKEITSYLISIPVTTGDISGQVNSVLTNNNTTEIKISPMPNFAITFYKDFKKQKVAASVKSDAVANYVVRLEPGAYFAEYPDGIMQKINVILGKVTNFNPGLRPGSALMPRDP